MASYDWFKPTAAQERAERERLQKITDMKFVELGYPNLTLVCCLCGSVIYGKIDDKWAALHRSVCQETTSGKHKA